MADEETPRHARADLLTRPPCLLERFTGGEELVIDPVAQLNELADLLSRRLLSQQEYRVMKDRIVGRWRIISP
jgi:hypothetical protein